MRSWLQRKKPVSVCTVAWFPDNAFQNKTHDYCVTIVDQELLHFQQT